MLTTSSRLACIPLLIAAFQATAAPTEDFARWCTDSLKDVSGAIKKTGGNTFARRPESQQVVEVSEQYIALLASIRRQQLTYDLDRRTLQAGRGLAAIREVYVVLAKNPFERTEEESMKFMLDKSTGALDKKLEGGVVAFVESCK